MSVSKIDIRIQFPDQDVYTIQSNVNSGSVGSINAGEPTIKSGTAGAVQDMATTEPTTSQVFTGIAKTLSTDTASVAGVVTLYVPFPGIIYAAAALSAAAANTAALILALQYKRVTLTKTSQTFTVNTAASDATTNGILILGGEPGTSTIWFAIPNQVSIFGNPTT